MKKILLLVEFVGREGNEFTDEEIVKFVRQYSDDNEIHLYCRECVMNQAGEYIRMKGVNIHNMASMTIMNAPKKYDIINGFDEWANQNMGMFETTKYEVEINSENSEVENMKRKNIKVDKIADIIIPHHDRHDHLKECLDKLPNDIFNIIIVSGGSFSRNCNMGAKLAKTDNIIILNDDTLPKTDYLVEMCEMKEDIVGAAQQIPGIDCIFYGITFEGKEYKPCLSRTVKGALLPSGFLLRVKKSAWKKLKGFDEIYVNGAEDVDFSMRAINEGMSIGIFEKPIIHKNSQSEGRFTFAEKNDKIFKKRFPKKELDKLFPMVSVIIPSRKDEIFECMESLEKQTYPNIEIIKIVDTKKEGAGATRNKGIKKAKGEFIFFCDNDIRLEPDAIEKLYLELSTSKCDWAFGKFYWDELLYNEDKDTNVPKKGTDEYIKYFEFISSGSMVRSSAKPMFDTKMKRFEDWDLWITLDEKGHKGLFVDEVLFKTPKVREYKGAIQEPDHNEWIEKLYKKHKKK